MAAKAAVVLTATALNWRDVPIMYAEVRTSVGVAVATARPSSFGEVFQCCRTANMFLRWLVAPLPVQAHSRCFAAAGPPPHGGRSGVPRPSSRWAAPCGRTA